MAAIESDNARMRALLEGLARENIGLRQQLSSLTRGPAAAAAANAAGAGATEPAVLSIVTLLWPTLFLLLSVVSAVPSLLAAAPFSGAPRARSVRAPFSAKPASSCHHLHQHSHQQQRRCVGAARRKRCAHHGWHRLKAR